MRLVAVADSDSYVKWAAAMLSRMPADWQLSLVIVATPKRPSADQLAAALSGSGIAPEDVVTLPLDRAVDHIVSEHPDAMLVATIGPLADVVTDDVLTRSVKRPVVISGVPGIALPARRKALVYRSQAHLIVLHSRVEIRRFEVLARRNRLGHEFALATLPFLAERSQASDAQGPVIFAAQAIVPPTREQRVSMLRSLVSFACRYPHLRVVLKVRAVAGEGQTHAERWDYASLLASDFPSAPENIVIASGPMEEHLRGASALVTVSSTAAIEAVALGIPVMIIDDFGVSNELINGVFVGSDLLGGTRDLLARDFREPNAEWLDDNYFHPEADNTWVAAIADLVSRNRAGQLPVRPRIVRGGGGALRRAWDRKQALGSADRSLMGYLALAVGTPARMAVFALHGLVRLAIEPREAPSDIALDDEAPALPESSERAPRSR